MVNGKRLKSRNNESFIDVTTQQTQHTQKHWQSYRTSK